MVTHFIITYHISIMNLQTNYCSNNLLILDVNQLNKIMKFYYFYTLKVLWDGPGCCTHIIVVVLILITRRFL